MVNYTASLSASYEIDFWGKNRDAALAAEETATANRFDRDVVALTTLAGVANAYFQVLASQDRIRTAERNIASATRILDAIKARFKAGTGTDLDVAQQESRARQPAGAGSAAAADAGAERQRAGDAGGAAAGKREGHRRLAQPDLAAAGDARPAVGIADAAARTSGARKRSLLPPPPMSAAPARSSFPSIQLTGQGGYQSSALVVAVPAPCGVLQRGRRPDPADFRRRPDPGQFRTAPRRGRTNCCRPTARRWSRPLPMSTMRWWRSAQTTEKLRLQREVVAASRRAFQLSEQQLRAGTADIVTVLNTQLTLFQAEDMLWQAQLARLLAIVSLYQALGGGWEPRMERPVNAL